MTRLEELICSSDVAKVVMSACDVGRGWFPAFLYDWQTLISGGLAVLAAFVTVLLLRRQIKLQQAQFAAHREQVKRENHQKVKAALIGIPHALVEIQRYLEGCFEAWENEKPEDRPQPPTEALKVIMDAAAYVDDESFESMRQLVVHSQTFESRLTSTGKRPVNVLSDMIIDLAELSYMTLRLFEIGRMEKGATTIPYVKPTRTDIEQVLNRDFGIRYRVKKSPALHRITTALRMRYPNHEPTPVTSDAPPLQN